MVPLRAAALVLVLMSMAAMLPSSEAVAAPEAVLPQSYDGIIDSPYFPKAAVEVDRRHQGAYALTYYAFGYMEARRNDWQRAWSGDATQLLSPEFTYLMAADADGRQILSVGDALVTWGTCTYEELLPAAHDYPVGDPAFWTVKVWSQAGESAWREAPEHRPMASYTMEYSTSNLAQIKTLLLRGTPVVVASYGLAGTGPNGFLDDDIVVSRAELIGQSFSHYHTIIGYDDTMENDGERGAVRVMTSYGPDFGESGSFWITYAALQAMANLHANDFSPHVDDAFLCYLDGASGGPTALLIWEYGAPPTLDCLIDISLMGQSGSPVTSSIRPFTGSRWYGYTHHFPRFMCLDISEWTAMMQWPEIVLRMDQATTPQWAGASGTIGCLVVEIYGDGYSSAERLPPTLVSGQSVSAVLGTPFRVYNDLTFQRTVPIAEAADAPGQRFLSTGVWTFYGIQDREAVGGSCLRTPESSFREETRLETEMLGPGTVSFRWRGVGNGVQGGLSLLVDGTAVRRLASTTGWMEVTVAVPEGLHRLAWTTHREDEGSVHTLDDYYLLDNIRVHGSDDILEENDVAKEAAFLTAGEHALICADADWFEVQLDKGDGLRAELNRNSGRGGLQFFLKMPGGGEISAVNEGERYVLVLEKANDYMRARFCVRAEGIDISRYTLLATVMKVDDPGARSVAALISGDGSIVAGDDSWLAETVEGGCISGSLTLDWRNAWAEKADLLLIPSWGDHSQAYRTYPGEIPCGNGTSTIVIEGLEAPKGAGTYWIFLAFRSGVEAAQLASSSFDNGGTVEWNDGDDIGDLGEDDVASILSEGRVWLRFFGSGGITFRVPVPCAVLQVQVADITPPVTSMSLRGAVGEGCWYTTEVEVTLTAMDPSGISATDFCLDGGEWMRYDRPFRISSDGSHTISYRSVDILSHVETVRTSEILIDQGAPEIRFSLTGGKEGEWFTTKVDVAVLCIDQQSACVARYRIDRGSWEPLREEVILQVSGRRLVEIECQDGAGNTASLARQIDIDLDAPTLDISLEGERLNGEWYGGTVVALLAARDADSGVAARCVSLDGGAWKQCADAYLITTSGQHRLECRAVDAAGNVGEVALVRINIDLKTPQVEIVGRSAGNGLVALDGPQVTVLGTDDVAVHACFVRIDKGGWTTATNGVEEVGSGVHNVEAYAVDEAGRIGTILTAMVVFDPDRPVAALQVNGIGGIGGWYRGPVLLNVSATDVQPGPVVLTMQINGREVNPASFLLNAPGWHEVMYMAMDRAGNVDGPFTLHLGVDETAPLLAILPQGTHGANGWYIGDVKLCALSSDGGSGIATQECNLDGRGWQSFDGTALVRYDGVHTVEVRSTDRAGNTATAKLELHIDSGGPLLPWTDGAELRLTEKAGAFNIKAEDWCSGLTALRASVDGGEPMPLNVLSPSIELRGLSDGGHVLRIEAQDGAGNVAERIVTLHLNTDPLDPEGPYGLMPLAMLTAAVLLGAAWWVRRVTRR